MAGFKAHKAISEQPERAENSEGTMNNSKPRRRRARRACDDCHGRKIKCDGGLPCQACQDLDQECSYNKHRKSRYRGPAYIEELERKISMLQSESSNLKSILSILIPDVNMEDMDALKSLRLTLMDEIANISTSREVVKGCPEAHLNVVANSSKTDELLGVMTEATGKLSFDDQGHCEYHGDFAGLSFLRKISERCWQLLDADFTKSEAMGLPQAFLSEGIPVRSSKLDFMKGSYLPPRITAQRLTEIALNEASLLMVFIDFPSFTNLLGRVYSVNPGHYLADEEAFLPLLYVTLAIGELYSGSRPDQGADSLAQARGLQYFRVGQALLDTANCRDIISLQAIVCIIVYLQSTASMHSCYSYISMAISVCLQMGLHRSEASKHIDPIQQEVRKRIFWIIQTMETYVTTLLGLPTTLDEEDIDQMLPTYEDSVTVDSDGLAQVPSTIAAFDAHIRLITIMRRLVKEIYPRVKNFSSKSAEPYRVSYTRVAKFETELEVWFQSIQALGVSEVLDPGALRTQLLLRLAYAHVQMVLYRPFIHHIVRPRSSGSGDMRSFACASACIKAAMQIVWIAEELNNRGLLVGAYWFTVYIVFFSVMVLCMFIIGNPDDPTVDDTMTAAKKGRSILSRLAPGCRSAEKCLTSLESLFNNVSLLCLKRRESRGLATVLEDAGKQASRSTIEDITGDVMTKLSSLPTERSPVSAIQHHPNLLAMLGSPLETLNTFSPILYTPVYGHIGPLEEHSYAWYNEPRKPGYWPGASVTEGSIEGGKAKLFG